MRHQRLLGSLRMQMWITENDCMLLWDSAHNCRRELGAFSFSKTYLNQFFLEIDYTETKTLSSAEETTTFINKGELT